MSAAKKVDGAVIVAGFLAPTIDANTANILKDLHHNTGLTQADGFAIWRWVPTALEAFSDIEVPEVFASTIEDAFAGHAENLTELAAAVRNTQALAEQYRASPWPFVPLPPAPELDDDGKPLPLEWAYGGDHADIEKAEAVDDALNRIFVYVNKCGHIVRQ